MELVLHIHVGIVRKLLGMMTVRNWEPIRAAPVMRPFGSVHGEARCWVGYYIGCWMIAGRVLQHVSCVIISERFFTYLVKAVSISLAWTALSGLVILVIFVPMQNTAQDTGLLVFALIMRWLL